MVSASSVKPEAVAPPRHVAIIMDGNGRWAKARGLPRAAGHRQGAEAVRRAVEAAQQLGVAYMTLYAFSSENWKRPRTEVDDLMGLLRLYLRRELAELHANNVRLRFIGERRALSRDLVGLIDEAETKTVGNTGLTLVVAINYGSQHEIIEAARDLARAVTAGQITVDDITEESFASRLQTKDIPDPDLLIRTSGEQRLSNFLLWQSAYTELVFLDLLWPDFDKSSLEDAIHEFHRRERRYGALDG
jgi:undecaprenyl diphosphate synthase